MQIEHLRGEIPPLLVRDALRAIWQHVQSVGMPIESIREWNENKCWYPELREIPPILALREALRGSLQTGTPCEPQIIIHLPDPWPPGTPPHEISWQPHLDEEPPWADGREYSRIVGVPLTMSWQGNGGLIVYPDGPSRAASRHFIDAMPGDVVWFTPDVWHCSGPNVSPEPRVIVYFRFLE